MKFRIFILFTFQFRCFTNMINPERNEYLSCFRAYCNFLERTLFKVLDATKCLWPDLIKTKSLVTFPYKVSHETAQPYRKQYHVIWMNSCMNTLKPEVHLSNIYKFISYLIENILSPHYKGQQVGTVYCENNPEHINPCRTVWTNWNVAEC
jgi:hypothetical protein